jgi:hypothetical protein
MPAEDPKSFVHDVTPERMGFYFCMRDLADYLKDQWPDNKEEDFCIKVSQRFCFLRFSLRMCFSRRAIDSLSMLRASLLKSQITSEFDM